MYVCICNALNERQVQQALDGGAVTPASVFRHFERQVQCGKCVSTMRDMARDHCAGPCSPCAARNAPPVVNDDAPIYAVAAE